MGDSEVLVVRFHFNGVFVHDGSAVEYCDGDEGISHIEKDKLSIPELEGHLLDHTTFKRSVRMYWLPFGATLSSGMRLIVDDKSCLDMVGEIGSDGAVDIYTELIDVDMSAMGESDGAEGWVFITDKQKGLVKAIDHFFPMAEHRMCARHIYANGRKKHRLQKYQKRFWKIAKASNEMMFNYYKDKLAAKTPKGWSDLEKQDPIHWCRAWFKIGSNCESVDNNVSESFNSWIIDARFKPIIAMLEEIRIMVTRRIQENRSNSERWTMAICPNIIRKVNKIRHGTQYCHVLWNGATGFEVRDKKWRFTVDLAQKTCSCRYWQVSGLPCRHACAALFTMSDEPNNYINPCFSIDQYRATYQHVLQPVEHESQNSTSHNKHGPSHDNNVPLAIQPAASKGKGQPASKEKGQVASSSTKSTKRKAIEGYGLYYSERTGSSFIQTGNKRRLVSFATSKSKALFKKALGAP